MQETYTVKQKPNSLLIFSIYSAIIVNLMIIYRDGISI